MASSHPRLLLLALALCAALAAAAAPNFGLDVTAHIDFVRRLGSMSASVPATDALPSNFSQALDRICQDVMQVAKIPGLSIGVLSGSETVYSKGFGVKSTSSGGSVDDTTIFFGGSTSKAFTAMLHGMLRDAGTVDFDRPVRELFAAPFSLMDPLATFDMSVRDMLSHRSGFPDHGHDLSTFRNVTRRELVYAAEYAQPAAELRQKWLYSNWMIMAAGYLAGELSGQTWEALVQSRVFDPLNMTRSFTDPASVSAAGNFAMPHVTQPDGSIVEEPPAVESSFRNEAPAGGVASTAQDYLKWVGLHLNDGKTPSGDRLVSNTSLYEMHSLQTSLYPTEGYTQFWSAQAGENITIDLNGYGLCWLVENYRGVRHVWHDGQVFGMDTQVSLIPQYNTAVVVFANRDQVNPYLTVIARYVIDLISGKKPWVHLGALQRVAEQDQEQRQQRREAAEKQLLRKFGVVDADPVPFPMPPDGYTGEFDHPLYGPLTIATVSGSTTQLTVVLGEVSGTLTHVGEDVCVFAGGLGIAKLPVNTVAQFAVNPSLKVDSVSFFLTKGIDPIVWTNKNFVPPGEGYPVDSA